MQITDLSIPQALCERCHEPVSDEESGDGKGYVWAEVKDNESKSLGVIYMHRIHVPDWFPGAR
jgi:hypothetical protein